MKRSGKPEGESPTRPDIPALMRQRRKALEMTGAELAEKAGISPSWISLIESRQRVPSEDVAARIAEALGADIDEFRLWAGMARLGGRTRTYVSELEGLHQEWVTGPTRPWSQGLLSPDYRFARGASQEDSPTAGDADDAGRGVRAREDLPEEMSQVLEASTTSPGAKEPSYLPLVPLISPDYPLTPGEPIPPSAIIGRVPADVRALRRTSGNLVAVELDQRNAEFTEPRLSPGDLVVVDLEDREVPSRRNPDLIYLVQTAGGLIFSSCFRKGRLLILTPEGSSQSPEILEPSADPTSSPAVIGRVVWSTHSYDRSPD